MSTLVTELLPICTKAEIAQFFRVSIKTIDAWRKRQSFPKPLPSTRRRWYRESVLSWALGQQEGGDRVA
jgi:hypothetical protein